MANNVAVIGICSVFLVAAVVAAVVGVTHLKNNGDSKSGEISSSTKAVQTVCQPTQFKEACEKSLESSNSTDPKELIRTSFQAAIEEIRKVLANSAMIQDLNKDDNNKAALKVCKEVLDLSIADLQLSFDKLGGYEMSKIGDYLLNLRVWLSGALTTLQTCVDSYAEVNKEQAEKMNSILKTSMELTQNSLTMVTKLSTILNDLNIPGINIDTTGFERKLLSNDGPEWMGHAERRLLQAKPTDLKPNVVVAKDGSGKYDTITKALAEVPQKSPNRFIIHIKAGTYKEQVLLPKEMTNVMFIGDGPTKTIITNDLNCIRDHPLKTFGTATVGVDGAGFMARDIGFENTAGPPGHQAVAFRATCDMVIMFNCHFNGYQDTLYAHKQKQFYRDCLISGTVDFIFGDAASVFQNCLIIARKPGENQNNMITAHGRKFPYTHSAIVLQNCTISGAPDYLPVKDKSKTYLGRPWKALARTIIMQSNIDDIITPEGYSPMEGTVGLDTGYFVEFQNRGPGAKTEGRVKWPAIKTIDINEAKKWTPGVFLETETDKWISQTGTPCYPDMVPGV
ncbi:hypothetical protein ERO13_D09G237800v2 [Gossypium hirsutum]|uniref:Pectinesterase n=1 Tax=Gossypium hirsutum TaxID=3635 RepID=A0A1U8LH88_GOSHI|nr:pectinesterase-like [Gossypium hirsutum]KAG4131819.1 hypothetical protein ERO13_D09G237800v2 [Gossypium hirsutum]